MQTTFLCFSHNLNYALGWTVVHSLWQATAVALLSGILMIVLREKTAKLRYLLSNLALFTVLAAAITTFCIYYDFTKEAGQVVFIPTEMETSARFETSPTLTTPTLNPIEGPLSIDGLKAYFNRHIYLIVTIWILGVALFMLRLLGSISYVYYLKSRLNFPVDEYWQELLDGLKNRVGVQRGIELLESAMVRSPIVIGHLKPVILFPIGAINRLNPNEVEAILAHELAHIMRNDYVFNIIQSVIEALFYFHPAVWWISAQIRNERENCCDDMAIELCGNSMTYAKSLVSVQEMAYYSPQMAMAFAGKGNKNQLLLRVQRVLNQPQTKTNVREKLIATCVLLLLMVTLSFSSNKLNQKQKDLINSTETTTESSSETTTFSSENDAHTEGSSCLKFTNKNNELDSFPMKYEIKDGAYTFSDATQNVDLTVKNNSITQFNINGLEVASADIPKFEKLIKRIVMPQPPEPPTPPTSPMFPSGPPSPPSPPSSEGFSMQSNGNQLNVDNNGLHLSGIDDQGRPVNLSVDNNGLVMQGDGVHMNFSSDEDDYEEDSKPIDGKKSYHPNGQIQSIVGSNRRIQQFNDKGELEVIIKSNGVVKRYKNKKLVTVNNNGKENNSNYSYSTNNKTNNKNKDPYNTLQLKADNGFSYVNFTLNGESIWKCYRNNYALGDLKIIKNKPYFVGHEATSEELKQLGLLWYNNSLNPLTGGFQIITNKTNNSHFDGIDEDCDDCLDDLREDLKELQEKIKQYQDNGSKRVELKSWTAKLNKLSKKLSKDNVSAAEITKYESELDGIRLIMEMLYYDCDNCGEKSGFNHSFTSDENDKRKYKIDEAQIRRNAEQAARNAEQTVRNAEQVRRNQEQIRRNAEQAKRNAEQQKRNTDNDDSQAAKDNLFRNLVNEGYIKLNEKCTVKFDSDALKVNGKTLNADVFKRFKADFEQKLKKRTDYYLMFNGVVNSVSATGLHMTGTFSYSVSNDD